MKKLYVLSWVDCGDYSLGGVFDSIEKIHELFKEDYEYYLKELKNHGDELISIEQYFDRQGCFIDEIVLNKLINEDN